MDNRKQHRLKNLQNLIAERSSLHIKDAAEMLDVSEMTIRRDVRENAEQFEYLGGHIVPADKHLRRTPYDLGMAADVHEVEKKQACLRCLQYTENQDIIFVDCGTTLVYLIDLLPKDTELTVVCYALNVADRAVRKPNLKLVLVGGEYHSPTATFAGLESEAIFAKLGINTGFFSAAGLDENIGATCTNFNETVQKRAALANTQRKILVMDSSKIGKVTPARYANIDEFDVILTEDGPFEFPVIENLSDTP
jgi:DeoR family deoxyribose operon repressor